MCKKGESISDGRIRLAKESREKVLKHEKFPIFEAYASAIGIDKVPEGIEAWKEHDERVAKREQIEAEKKLAEEKRLAEQRRIDEENRIKEEAERKIKEEKEK